MESLLTSYSGQPRTVTSSYKYAAPKKDEKVNFFDQITLRIIIIIIIILS